MDHQGRPARQYGPDRPPADPSDSGAPEKNGFPSVQSEQHQKEDRNGYHLVWSDGDHFTNAPSEDSLLPAAGFAHR
jgi:hypothetical protein